MEWLFYVRYGGYNDGEKRRYSIFVFLVLLFFGRVSYGLIDYIIKYEMKIMLRL